MTGPTKSFDDNREPVRPVRVLLLRNCRGISEVSGGEAYLLAIMNELNGEDVAFRLLCVTDPRTGQTSWLRQLASRNVPFETITVPRWSSPRDLAAMPGKVRAFGADIIHSMDHRSDVVAAVAGRLTRRPAVAWFAGWTNFDGKSTRWRFYAWADRQALKRMQAVIVDSAYLARQLDLGSSGPPVVAIPNGVDLEKFDPDGVSASKQYGFASEPDAVVFGIVGRIHPNKGQLDFVKAAAALASEKPSCRFIICGDAPPGFEGYKREVLRLISRSGLEERIRVFSAPAADIPRVLKHIDVVLAPCHTESCSFAVLEGMAMRKAVVAANAGGNPDLIRDGQTGILVQPQDWEALKAGADLVLNDPLLRDRLGHSARREVEARYSVQTMGARTLRVYKEVAAWYRERVVRPGSRDELRRRLSAVGVFIR